MKTIEERFEEGLDHHPNSIEVSKVIRKNDKYGEYEFGGDGDNGETLLYYLDMYFEEKENVLCSQKIDLEDKPTLFIFRLNKSVPVQLFESISKNLNAKFKSINQKYEVLILTEDFDKMEVK